ncbi:MAG: ribonuclease P protein component [Pelotomaculum sp.]|uniref:Ribonuclease P protein component n=1 Tax=Pelotomaculum thermopropionicum (strain DSM 13744 / JCM 10971 / SI) TaxID=370438 RepID=RNPA_PELTS|nr:RecName: Full=Ribonuclease P protein component; Short=RNase P protein; Short=RNaseP protein; AltName: Full=Protein C5 [Pelotomaculum thermopropionicum SI]NPV74594.1 ribonuclease P protein component [Pelotomaculum sp.]BAF61101.1 RNase P protein component [Pelotomaculum thermopropionicum SI]
MKVLDVLKKNKDYGRVCRRGKSVADRHIVMYFLDNNLGRCRYGFAVSRKIRSAVRRNRARRLLREACRLNKEKFPEGYDFVFMARRDMTDLKCQQVEESILKLLKRAEINRS